MKNRVRFLLLSIASILIGLIVASPLSIVVSGFQANEKCDQMLGVRLCQATVQLCDVYQPSEISHLQANEQQMHMLNK